MRHKALTVKLATSPIKGVLGLSAGLSLMLLASCSAVPSDGPLASEVERAAVSKSNYTLPKTAIIFDVVQVDQRVANLATQLGQPSLVQTFGVGGAPGTPVIGVGDELAITVFEAGPDGLFSTSDHKSTSIPVIVQPDGHGQIPYAGSVKFVGLTLEQARLEIADALKAKAVEPDVIVSMAKNVSRTVSVQGNVNSPQIVSLGLSPVPLTSVIAMAGGATKAPYDTYVTLTRGKKSSTVRLQSVIENPRDDVHVRPGDKVFLTFDPQTFTALGSTGKAGKIPFEASKLSLVEAAALSGGSRVDLADPKGYFIFRYEYDAVYRQIVGESRFRDLISKGMMADKEGKYPVVYRIDMTDPQSYIVTQSFPVRNKDVMYVSRHPSTDFVKFLNMLGLTARVAREIDKTVSY
jgi:polysaccharide export outer membrane protein